MRSSRVPGEDRGPDPLSDLDRGHGEQHDDISRPRHLLRPDASFSACEPSSAFANDDALVSLRGQLAPRPLGLLGRGVGADPDDPERR